MIGGRRLKPAVGPALGALVLMAGGLAMSDPAGAATVAQTFRLTGALQQFTVPAGICGVSITAIGGSGGTSTGVAGRRRGEGHRACDRHARGATRGRRRWCGRVGDRGHPGTDKRWCRGLRWWWRRRARGRRRWRWGAPPSSTRPGPLWWLAGVAVANTFAPAQSPQREAMRDCSVATLGRARPWQSARAAVVALPPVTVGQAGPSPTPSL